MRGSRLDLQELLVSALTNYGGGEEKDVYFQPPPELEMDYPAIVYGLSTISKRNANNSTYFSARNYSITFMTYNPESELVDKFLELFDSISFDRTYTSDNLNHYVYTLYF